MARLMPLFCNFHFTPFYIHPLFTLRLYYYIYKFDLPKGLSVNPSGGYPDCAKAAYCDEAARPPVGEELIRLELFQGSKMKDTKV
jgi:hypothetical protein